MKFINAVLFISFLVTKCIYGAEPTTGADNLLQKSMVHFRSGEYAEALKTINQVSTDDRRSLKYLYWKGLFHFKLQNYQEAIGLLQQAANADVNHTFTNTWYVLGQCQYAVQDFKSSRQSFLNSAAAQYKRGPSEFYIGFISQLLKEYDEALRRYQLIQSLPSTEWEMKQPAAFETAEIYFQRAMGMGQDSEKRKALRSTVIPAYEWARDLDKKNPLSGQATQRIAEVQRQLGLLAPRTKNKSLIPVKPWVVRLSQYLKYDTNVLNEPDNRIIKVTNRSSPVSQTGVFGKYEFIFWNWVVLTPEIAADASFHGNRGNREIYSNDNTNITPAVRMRLDHEIRKRPAAGLMEYEYAWNSRDSLGDKSQLYYNKYNNFILGERLNFFGAGPTTIKANLKLAEFANTRLNYLGPGLSVSQTWMAFKRHALNAALSFENQWTNDRLYAQRNYRLNLGYSMPALFWNTSVDLAFNFGLIDTVNQRETRGWEKNYNPTLGLSKILDDANHWLATVSYSYTENVSKDDVAYSYAKHVGSVGIQYTF